LKEGVSKAIFPADAADAADFFQGFQHKNLPHLREVKFNSVAIA